MVIFGAGVITGGLVVKHAAPPVRNRASRGAAAPTNAPAPNVVPAQLQRMEFLLRVRSELNLTPEQHDRIEKIIREGQEKSRKIWETVAPDMRKELQAVHEKIRVELGPEQRRRFEELLKRTPRPNLKNPENIQPQPQPRPARRENFPPQGNPSPEYPPPEPLAPR